MALSLSTQVAVVASRSGVVSLSTCSTSAATGSAGPSADSFGGRHHNQGGAVCLQGPVLKSRVSNVGQQESLSSTTSLGSPYQSVQQQLVKQQQWIHPTQRRTGVPGNEAHPNPNANSSALIDIEESGDGCITFKYGAVEDIWDLDRLLEYLAGGAFSSHTTDSFVRVVVELFKIRVSYTGQRRMVELLSAHLRLHSDVSPEVMEKAVGQVLAEAASEFLPPSSVGSYGKGSARPYKRFSSQTDKWWKSLDSYLGVGEGSVDFMPEPKFDGFGEYAMQWSGKFEKLDSRISYEPFSTKFSQPVITTTTTQFTWKDPPSKMPWLARPSDRLYLESPKTSSFEFVREAEETSRPGGPGGGEDISGLDFIMFPSSDVNSLEDVLRETEVVDASAPEPDLHFAQKSGNRDTIPAAQIQAMVEWEQEEVFAMSVGALPSKPKSRVKVKAKKVTTTQYTKRKTDPRVRASTSSTKSASKKKSTTEKRNESQLCDMFFGLPISHKCSGVASFLAMRRNFGGEMLVAFNQVAVGFAGVGVAVTLHVVARMLSVNSTFDSSKLFGLIRGAALMVLSATMQSVRKVMLRLPVGCTVSDSKDKTELLCLQQRLRRLSVTAMTVMVLAVVGNGI
ncbi:unnamed protein product [Calypogeia fissa]